MGSIWIKIRVLGLLIGILNLGISYGQERYVDRKGIVVFEASEKLFEPVKAKNESVSVLFDASNNKIAALALIRGFQFKNPLMQEHFNENYMESDQYPKALFKGEIMGFNIDKANSTTQEYVIKGTLEIRGIAKTIEPTVQIQKIDNVMAIGGSFTVVPGDFNIEIPKIVENKIAKTVMVKLDFKLTGDHEE
ncbi:YceI family protein [Muricauda sp. MAR_2010_75]|uniref:YceI family protein n=1 Tax=Allomuricauda sp. MAR_2010_75 TaxID=1250232 RepID=UPI00055D3997|nr:YceI family protein [Muricauda sp. MAR_2010_75]